MRTGWQWLKSLLFSGIIYAAMVPYGLWYLPAALRSRDGAVAACRGWSRFVLRLADLMLGLRSEVRGTPPDGACLIASKHQSFLDIIMLYAALPRGKFIMKKELTRAPILGWFALRIGCIPVDRGRRAQAIKKMIADVNAGRADPGQLIIYPQGTRLAPGEKAPYKIGTSVLYGELGQDCVPVACNVGLFWPRRGILRRPGTAVIEFLPRIPAGMAAAPFMALIESEIEANSDRLMAEAGFPLVAPPREA
ncbi:lysophospholipid acyltransferase family protein [Wenxinia marina]|uniref:1-acyl-sn-glycerol-3-phosphate acyltransferase n=1 Tax=Wenxinia marina DSM 24838 TaxID=1123501 RepID=A0A0D0PHH3_9RHOB|nr:lysophospholipid acyltransferase family protein [Wenxinia marina]KIQ70806.1 1-acyl-sn-glycerol-3-phosphate acyltransferase [Wenxinia marina DSM 24838]GGL57155.1 1-acyl-sn-glycerol-3-phosphate acyltransferase [Wenxinia marina]